MNTAVLCALHSPPNEEEVMKKVEFDGIEIEDFEVEREESKIESVACLCTSNFPSSE